MMGIGKLAHWLVSGQSDLAGLLVDLRVIILFFLSSICMKACIGQTPASVIEGVRDSFSMIYFPVVG